MPTEPITPGDQPEAHAQKLVSSAILRRLGRLVEDSNRQTRLERVATRLLIVFLAIVAVAGFGTAIWNSYYSPAALSRRSVGANPWIAYGDSVRQKVQQRMDAEYAKDHVPGQGKSLKLRIRLKADGDLDSVEVERTSDSIAVDEFAMRTVRESAPFGPLPIQLQKATDVVTISTTFALH